MQHRRNVLQSFTSFVVLALLLFFVQTQATSLSPHDSASSNLQLATSATSEYDAQSLKPKDYPSKVLDAQSMELSITYAGSALWQGTNVATGNGNYAFSYPMLGLQVIDLTNPSLPTVVAEYYHPLYAEDILFSDDYIYVVGGQEMLIFDVSAPESPALVSTTSFDDPLWPSAQDVEKVGSYVYVSAHRYYYIIDVTNPNSPVIVNTISPQGLAMNSAVSGDYAYIAAEFWLELWDISDPMAPVFKTKLTCGDDAYDVALSGNYAYVANRQQGLYVINASNPPFITEIASWIDTTQTYSEVERFDDYVYLIDYNVIRIIDVQNPFTPTLAANWSTYGFNRNVELVGNRAVISDWTVGVTTYDMMSPTAPLLEATYETPGMGYDLAISGNYAYEANGIKGLQVMDITDPEIPVVISSFTTPGNAKAVDVKGDLVFITGDSIGIMIVNISDPAAPFLEGTSPGPPNANDIVVDGDYAYVAASNSGLKVFDVSNPQAPFLTGELAIPNYTQHIEIANGYAYVSSYSYGMYIVDISNPSTPSTVGEFNGSGFNVGFTVSGNYAFLGNGSNGNVSVIDVTTPNAPLEVGSVPDIGRPFSRQMKAVGDYLYVAAYLNGLKILNISNPTAPYLAGHFELLPAWSWDIDVVGSNIYLACDNGFISLWQDGCGGPNGLSSFDVVDLSFLVAYLFTGGSAPQPLRVGDLNCDDGVDIGDVVFMADFLFLSGPPPCGGCF